MHAIQHRTQQRNILYSVDTWPVTFNTLSITWDRNIRNIYRVISLSLLFVSTRQISISHWSSKVTFWVKGHGVMRYTGLNRETFYAVWIYATWPASFNMLSIISVNVKKIIYHSCHHLHGAYTLEDTSWFYNTSVLAHNDHILNLNEGPGLSDTKW